MLIGDRGSPSHLTYCTNVHPAETAAETIAVLTRWVAPVREALGERGRGGPFGVGLRLSRRSQLELTADGFLAEHLADALMELDGYAPTVNAFPFGAFHSERVKEDVHRPDWTQPERVDYTVATASILARLPAVSAMQSVSTSPGSFKEFGDVSREAIAANLARVAAELHILEMETERCVVLGVEPEPGCTFETIAEWITFFEEDLLRGSWPAMEALKPGHRAMQQDLIRRHVGLCFDCCHQAVEYEDVETCFDAIEQAGVFVAKVQLSNALEIREPGRDHDALEALRAFDEPRYLHQVIARRRDGGLDYFRDLPDYLAAVAARDDESARVHFHVPVFLDEIGPLRTTQRELEHVLARLSRSPAEHLEIETYTWDVLPERRGGEAGDEALIAGIAREYEWVLQRLG